MVSFNEVPVFSRSKIDPTASPSTTEAGFAAVALSTRYTVRQYPMPTEAAVKIRSSVIYCKDQGMLKIFMAEPSMVKACQANVKVLFVKQL